MPTHDTWQAADMQSRTLRVHEVMFDMDGTLVDSMPGVEAAWEQLAIAAGIRLPHLDDHHGRPAAAIIADIVPADGREEATRLLDGLEWQHAGTTSPAAGAVALLSALPPDRWSVVTSATRRIAARRLASAGIPTPDSLTSAEDVSRGKPDPEPYIVGRRYASEDGRALVVEDTVPGLTAARAAGCIAVGVTGTTDAAKLLPHADVVIEALDRITVTRDGDQLVLHITGVWQDTP